MGHKESNQTNIKNQLTDFLKIVYNIREWWRLDPSQVTVGNQLPNLSQTLILLCIVSPEPLDVFWQSLHG